LVRFNGTSATPGSWSASSIVVLVPAGATTGNIVVTVGGVASPGVGFTVGLPSTSPITLTQHAGLDTGGASATLAFPAGNVAGNFIVVAARARYANQTFTVSDTRSNVYRRALTVNNGTDDTLAIFYAENIAAGPNTVAVAVSTAPVSIRVAILEYAGIAPANALDVTATAAGSSASPSSASATTTVPGDLVIGVFSTLGGHTFTTGSSYTIREAVSAPVPSTKLMVQDQIQATAGPLAATAILNTPDIWGAGLAAFKPAAPSGAAQLVLASLATTSVSTTLTVSSLPVAPRTHNDYDGDGKADVAVYTPSTGTWSILESGTGTAVTTTLGAAGDRPVPGDYDGDGKTDIAVYRPATGEWSVLLSSTGALTVVTWGSTTDLPVPADYDRDGKTDVAIYRPARGEWIILQSSTQTTRTVAWGSSVDIPVPGDYDGDAKADLAVYRRSTGLWQMLQSGTNTTMTATRGSSGDLPMPGDYDGDGTTDVAVYHASTGSWSILQSSTKTMRTVTWGSASDVPMPGDYDGDGTTDLAVFRPSTGLWQILQSSTNTTMALTWGMSTDISVR
jgi:VCBS repeat protein